MVEDFGERWGLQLGNSHRAAIRDRSDPIHERCDFLVPESPYKLLEFDSVNAFLHDPTVPDPWPLFLVAFASNGCGDYFAYDLRGTPPSVIYVDPDNTVAENLAAEDKLRYESFDAWYRDKVR